MIFLFLSIIGCGLFAVIWLLIQESRKSSPQSRSNLLDRLGIDSEPTPAEKPSLKSPTFETLSKEIPPPYVPPPAALVEDVEPAILPSPDPELIAKCEKLETLLKEKSDELEKKDKALEAELRAKKEFHKVKDILEKEIKDQKDKNHKFQLESSAAQVEAENYKKRITQQEEKIRSKEQDILQKEKEIVELMKRMQTFTATPAPKVPAAQPQPAVLDVPTPHVNPPEPPIAEVQKPETQAMPAAEEQPPTPEPPKTEKPEEPKEAPKPESDPITPEKPSEPPPHLPVSQPEDASGEASKPELPKEKKFNQGEPIRQPHKNT